MRGFDRGEFALGWHQDHRLALAHGAEQLTDKPQRSGRYCNLRMLAALRRENQRGGPRVIKCAHDAALGGSRQILIRGV